MPKNACDMRMCLKKSWWQAQTAPYYEWLCDSFVELTEEVQLWKWDDATGDFWSRLAKALQQSNSSVTRAEQLDSRLVK